MTKRQHKKYDGKIRPVRKIWTTKEGDEIQICDMTDQHLKNAIKYLRRCHYKMLDAAYQALSIVSGEEAVNNIENAINVMEQEDSLESLYEDLLREARRRKMVI